MFYGVNDALSRSPLRSQWGPSVTPEWPLLVAERHKSVGDWLSSCSWCTHRPCERLGRRFQLTQGNLLWQRRGWPTVSRLDELGRGWQPGHV